MRSVKFMRAAKTSYIVLSALYCVFGVLLIAVPDFSMKLLGILVGCMMIGFGAVKLMGYFSRDLYRLAFQFDLAYGILLIVLGLIVLLRPVQLVSFFCLVLGIGIGFEALRPAAVVADPDAGDRGVSGRAASRVPSDGRRAGAAGPARHRDAGRGHPEPLRRVQHDQDHPAPAARCSGCGIL